MAHFSQTMQLLKGGGQKGWRERFLAFFIAQARQEESTLQTALSSSDDNRTFTHHSYLFQAKKNKPCIGNNTILKH